MKWRGRKLLDTFYSISTKFNHIFPAVTQTKIKRKRYCMFQFSPPCISQVCSIDGFEIHVPKDSRKIISHSSGTWHFKDFLIWAFANNNAFWRWVFLLDPMQNLQKQSQNASLINWYQNIIATTKNIVLNSTQPTLG